MKRFLKITGIIFLAAVFLGAALLFANEKANEKVRVTSYSFSHKELPESFIGFKILQISDLHQAPFAGQIEKIIREENPDIIVITGDMVQLPGSEYDETVKIAEKIKDIPIYAVSGNHETQSGEYEEIMKGLKESGIIPLDYDSVEIKRGDESILLVGVKDSESDNPTDGKLQYMKGRILEEFPDGPCFSILLMHRADLFPVASETPADLILSGHLHGGIIRLPFIGGIIGKNERGILPEYDYGLYEKNESYMIVSGGCDKNPKKRRIFNPPEVVVIELGNDYE